ncbi:DUF421 domain-containing protein [Pedobacter paludis]|uniref:DUF421 domain-containing protein n=2 Tax=Pedobacter paludis TaxID=2203212 RepID=A0A317F3R9_9SPHI|nr:DUF421 domain-containing protein [Pedobacter paludis]
MFVEFLIRIRLNKNNPAMLSPLMEDIRIFDFHRIFIGTEPIGFLLEIVFRTIIMYAYTIVLLRFLGKRSMGQLSTLELAIIICFGSAVGDPMMGAEVPILHGIVVITTVALLQTAMEWIINRNKKVENFMEGKADCLIDDGIIMFDALKKNNLSHADLFRSLRNKDVEHLGQVNKAFFETSGLVSVLFHPPKKLKPGLGILPDEFINDSAYLNAGEKTTLNADYSCTNCGFTKHIKPQEIIAACAVCKQKLFIKSDCNFE